MRTPPDLDPDLIRRRRLVAGGVGALVAIGWVVALVNTPYLRGALAAPPPGDSSGWLDRGVLQFLALCATGPLIAASPWTYRWSRAPRWAVAALLAASGTVWSVMAAMLDLYLAGPGPSRHMANLIGTPALVVGLARVISGAHLALAASGLTAMYAFFCALAVARAGHLGSRRRDRAELANTPVPAGVGPPATAEISDAAAVGWHRLVVTVIGLIWVLGGVAVGCRSPSSFDSFPGAAGLPDPPPSPLWMGRWAPVNEARLLVACTIGALIAGSPWTYRWPSAARRAYAALVIVSGLPLVASAGEWFAELMTLNLLILLVRPRHADEVVIATAFAFLMAIALLVAIIMIDYVLTCARRVADGRAGRPHFVAVRLRRFYRELVGD